MKSKYALRLFHSVTIATAQALHIEFALVPGVLNMPQSFTGLSLAKLTLFALLNLLCLPFFAHAGTGADAHQTLSISNEDPTGGDPLHSQQWPSLKTEYFNHNAKIEFDDRVRVDVPPYAEDAMNVPVSFDASALGKVKKIVVLVDRNPIRKVLEFIPDKIKPTLNFRFKLQQASPIRVAALGEDNIWHVGSAFIEAAGGGCTVPGATRADGSWPKTLGKVASRMFEPNPVRSDARLRFQVSHPMDTGLVDGIPAFYIEELNLMTENGQVLAKLFPFEPVSENPLFSFDFYTPPQGPMKLIGHDNNGNRIDAEVSP